MSNLTVTSPSAPSMRACCNTTFQTIGHGLKKISTWAGAIAIKVAEAVKPYLQKIAAAILIAGSIAWNNTKVTFINHKKELALVGLGIAITLGVAALVKAIQFCYTMNSKSADKPEKKEETTTKSGEFDPNAAKDTTKLPEDEKGTLIEESEEDITPPPSPAHHPLPVPDAVDAINESSESSEGESNGEDDKPVELG